MRVRCPRITCRSANCTPVTADKNYKVGKGLLGGLVGGAALGPIGAVVGLASGANGKRKITFVCNDCGNVFTVKM